MRSCQRATNYNTGWINTFFFLEAADTPDKARIGLSNRHFLDEDKGMLFFAPFGQISMWMKDTYIPLDMLFFDKNGKIVYIYTARPLDLTPISANQPVAGVIELVGGICKKLGINQGDLVRLMD